jgi:hypothetical protein
LNLAEKEFQKVCFPLLGDQLTSKRGERLPIRGEVPACRLLADNVSERKTSPGEVLGDLCGRIALSTAQRAREGDYPHGSFMKIPEP